MKVEAKSCSDTIMFHSRVLPIWKQQWLFSQFGKTPHQAGLHRNMMLPVSRQVQSQVSVPTILMHPIFPASLSSTRNLQSPSPLLQTPLFCLCPCTPAWLMSSPRTKLSVYSIQCSTDYSLFFRSSLSCPLHPSGCISPAFSLCQVHRHQKDLSD